VLTNVPRITDVDIMGELVGAMGVDVRRGRTPDELVVTTPADIVPEAPYELVEKMRASVVVLGPLLARCGRAKVSLPGGDDFGPRPIDMHLHALESMGASFTSSHGYVEAGSSPPWHRCPAWSATGWCSSTPATPAPTTC
jgi:UDP-N-acetylglucosamine 1-carboxyvinyltransferase